VQSDAEQSQSLSAAIAAQGDVSVSLASTVREACLLVAQESYDIVLVDDADEEGAARALRALQPQLPLRSLSLENIAAENGARLEELFGFLFGDETEEPPQPVDPALAETQISQQDEIVPGAQASVSDAETLLDTRPWKAGDETLAIASPEAPDPSPPADPHRQRLAQALQEASEAEKIVGCILTAGDNLLAAGGALTLDQVQGIRERVDQSTPEAGSIVVQFIRLADLSSEFLLLTRPASEAQRLTVAAAPDVNVGRLRRAADALAEKLVAFSGVEPSQPPQEPPPVATTHSPGPDSTAPRSFALIFQPRRPLPTALQEVIRDALQEVAARAECRLLHANVEAELVHIVTTCPDGRGSGWLAHRYKQGVGERVQEQFGVQAQLWRRGFYATESDQPLSDIELNLFLAQ
jgi:hypothetical protein